MERTRPLLHTKPVKRSAPALLGLLLLAVAPPAAAQQAPVDGAAAAAAIRALTGSTTRPDAGAVTAFWTAVRKTGTPLVDSAPVPGHSVVTFVYRGGPSVSRVRLVSNLNALLVSAIGMDVDSLGIMTLVPDTDVWYQSFQLRNDVRAPYRFEVTRADSTVTEPDPLNPPVWEPEQAALAASILELPGAPDQPWRGYAESDKGDWDQWKFDEGPDSGRTVYIYKPQSWSADRAEAYPVLIGLGAFGHGTGMRVDRMLDHLIESGQLPPMVVALADLERGADTTAYQSTTDFVADRFLPWLAQRYNTSRDPGQVVMSGTSRRGMVAAVVAHRRPDAVGNVISLSGSYYWRPAGDSEYEWASRLYAESPARPVKLYVTAGELETVVSPGNAGHYMVATNRHFRNVLSAAGYHFTYHEFNGVHSELNWQDGLAKGLIQLIGSAR
jgi:enterochelin esterase family protein